MQCYSWVVHFSFLFLVHYRIPGDIFPHMNAEFTPLA